MHEESRDALRAEMEEARAAGRPARTFVVHGHDGKDYTCCLMLNKYLPSNDLHVSVMSSRWNPDNIGYPEHENWERFATISIDPNCRFFVQHGEFLFKTYSENMGLHKLLLRLGLVTETGHRLDVGLAGPQPVCRLTDAPRDYIAPWGCKHPDDEAKDIEGWLEGFDYFKHFKAFHREVAGWNTTPQGATRLLAAARGLEHLAEYCRAQCKVARHADYRTPVEELIRRANLEIERMPGEMKP